MKNLLMLLVASVLCFSCTGGKAVTEVPKVPAPEDVVMYQVNPRNYAAENSFNAVASHLDSIKALGANVVWFMPIYELGELKAKNSPYCIRNYTALNPEFGTFEDFRSLVAECHGRGMSVIVDWVANHTSWDNAWIYDHPEWYTHGADGEIIHPEGTDWRDVADLDFSNAEMCQAMIDAMKFWVEEAGVDGFRCDAADFVPFEFWQECLSQLRAIEGRELLMLAEGQRKDHFDAGFDMNYAWEWLSALRSVYEKKIPRVPVSTLFATDSSEYAGIPEGCVKLRFTTNHDENARMSPVREFYGTEGSLAAFVASTFIHGGMLVYGSQEVGYPGRINFFRYVDIDWQANSEMNEEYRRIIAAFKSSPAVRGGVTVPYPDDDVLVFERVKGDESVLVVVNMRDEQRNVALPESWRGRKCTDLLGGRGLVLPAELRLRPFEYLILR